MIKPKKLIIEDAKKIVSKELALNETVADVKYAEWFVKTLGRNVALMHKNGWFHNYLTPHNITLDCRIVDLDSVSGLAKDGDRLNDTDGAFTAIRALLYGYPSMEVPGIHTWEYYKDLFDKSYEAVFPAEKREKYFEKIRSK